MVTRDINNVELFDVILSGNAPGKVNHVPYPRADPMILMENMFLGNDTLSATGFHCQNPLPKDLYFYH